ncbi:hypothetical protein lerEdw1_020910 [Lerista edwardsae]|nr:hypothetical protein lerEdw1_020910 [Lerista edwardsae]
MTDSLVLMREVFLSVTRRRWKGILVQIDQSKAFDRIDRTYLWKTLRAKGVPDAFIEHLSYLYDRAKVVPMINGWPGDKVPISSGIRQGCPLSPLFCRQTYARTHPGRLSAHYTYFGPGSAGSRIDRGRGLIRQPECLEVVEACLQAWRQLALLRAKMPVAWWEALKREVARRCRALEATAYRRELRDYHRALARFLRAVEALHRDPGDAAGGSVAAAARRAEDERVIAAFHRKKREQRLQAQRYRARGPLLEPEEWEQARAAGGAQGRKQAQPFTGLRLRDGDPVEESTAGMLGVMGTFYGDLFTPQQAPAPSAVEAFLRRAPFPEPGTADGQGSLTEEERAALSAPVTPDEVRVAIRAGRSTSAPGADGLPYFFYQRFAALLAEPLADAFNAALQGRERFHDSFYSGLLRFLFKGGDPTLVQNWRPITVTNVDYRLLARILNARLAAVASRLVAEGQSNAVPGRRMGATLALMREVFLAAAGGRWRGLLIQLDQSKAFDRVDRDYLWAVLRERGVPEAFVRLLQGLYERATAVPVVQGWRGAPVPLASGLQQGCPLSPLLYVLALEPLLGAIRADGRITGILAQGSGRRLKAVAHADDAYVLLRHGEGELRALREILAEYGAVSGAAINACKSRCYTLGPGTLDIAWRPLEREEEAQSVGAGEGAQAATVVPVPPSVPQGDPTDTTVRAVKVLGVRFGLGSDAWELDWRAWAEAAEERMRRWGRWRLGVYQRVRLFEAYCVPAALLLAAVYPPPRAVVASVTAAFFRFVWGCRRFPLARAVAYQSVAEGVFGLAGTVS